MIIKIQFIDNLIIFIMFALLPVDMLNGFLLHNGINLPISIAQLFKISLILLIFFRLLFIPKKLLIVFILFLLLLIPSLIELIFLGNYNLLFPDLIKITRYLMPLICFLFFVEVIKNRNERQFKKLINLVKFSYLVLIFNVLIKYVGFGYSNYDYADIGSKGYFFAGNELSVLLIILSSIIGFQIWKKEKKIQYYLFLLLTMFVGLTMATKTGILGVLIVFFLIPIKLSLVKFNIKRLKLLVVTLVIIFPLIIVFSWRFIKISPIFIRYSHFYQKLDLITFILSDRNNYVKEAMSNYNKEYSLVNKIVGVGQTRFKQINSHIIEIDFLDIFFAYGFMGLFLFLFILYYIAKQAKRFKLFRVYPYANFVFLMLCVLFSISSFAGHVFGSGMAAVFIGLLFSLMYVKKDEALN